MPKLHKPLSLLLTSKSQSRGYSHLPHGRVRRTGNGLAVIGFSLGAYYALDLSAADPQHIHSIIVFLGTGLADFSAASAAYLGHFAEDDPYEPPSNVHELEEALESAGRPVTFYTYPGTGHWFFEPDRPDTYNPAASRPCLGSNPGLPQAFRHPLSWCRFARRETSPPPSTRGNSAAAEGFGSSGGKLPCTHRPSCQFRHLLTGQNDGRYRTTWSPEVFKALSLCNG